MVSDRDQCEALSLKLAGYVDGDVQLSPEEAHHVATCLHCQAELVHYRKLLRALQSLRGQPVLVDHSLLDDILDVVRPAATVHRLHRRGYRSKSAYLAGAAAAATAGAAAGALVLASRYSGKTSLAS
jgi:hypothetical protein